MQGKGPFESTELGTPSLKEGKKRLKDLFRTQLGLTAKPEVRGTSTPVIETWKVSLHSEQHSGFPEAPANDSHSTLAQRDFQSNSIHGQPLGPAVDLESGRSGTHILH